MTDASGEATLWLFPISYDYTYTFTAVSPKETPFTTFNFHSSSYDWLVVTGSDYARYKGTGTINGAGEYKFLIWAGDNEPDFPDQDLGGGRGRERDRALRQRDGPADWRRQYRGPHQEMSSRRDRR